MSLEEKDFPAKQLRTVVFNSISWIFNIWLRIESPSILGSGDGREN